jgi:type VI secretion system protein ImpH
VAAEGRVEDAAVGGGPAPEGTTPDAETPVPVTGAKPLEGLERTLRDDPRGFSFFRAVRALEQLRPDRAPVGGYGDPGEEVVHFSANPSLAFPSSEIESLDLAEGVPARMVVNFMGLIGPQGVLPHQYTLTVMERMRKRDDALRAFLDIFQHRALSLFYRAWEKNRFAVLREKEGMDPLLEHLMDLVGMGLPTLRERAPLSPRILASFAGLMGPVPRGALALEEFLEAYFDVPCTVEQFVGGWYRLERRDRCELGDEDSLANRLGGGAVAGDEVWDAQARVRVRLGPLGREQFDSFLPTGDAHGALRDMLHFFAHDRVEYEVQLVLHRDEVPGLVIGGDAPQPLGWSTWIRTQPMAREADGTTLYV